MRILVVGAHPDDIEPQMGGTIAKLVKNGHEVLIVQFTNTGGNLAELRNFESCKGAQILGAKIKHLNYCQNNFIFQRKLVQNLDEIIAEYKPDDIYTCWEYDSHQDHQIVSKVVLASCRKNKANIFFFEPIIPGGITPYGFETNYFVDISDTIEIKIESIKAHESQLDKFGDGWIDAVYGRAQLRGFQINTRYAEAFKVVKMISRV